MEVGNETSNRPCDLLTISETVDSSSNQTNITHGTDSVHVKRISKKELKRQRKKSEWESKKHAVRKRYKQNHKLKLVELKKQMAVLPPTRKQLKNAKMKDSPCQAGVVIDLSFDDLMNERELGKLSKQILRCYSINRRSKTPVQYYLTGLNDKFKEVLSKQEGYVNWDVNIFAQSYLELFPLDKIVYLSSDSDNVMDKFDNDKFYIIGGLVDHNSQKGLCYKLACENKIAHAQLPIKEHIDMKQRTVLTINQVFEIILRVCEGKTWPQALIEVIPMRKGARLKEENTENSVRVDIEGEIKPEHQTANDISDI